MFNFKLKTPLVEKAVLACERMDSADATHEVVQLTKAAVNPSDEPQDIESISFLSYNVGLLRLRLFGMLEVFANPPFCTARLPRQPDAIRALGADIVAIQECYEHAHFMILFNALKDLYPHFARRHSGGCIAFHNGLAILSRWPIVSVELEPLRKVATLEKYMASKCNLNVVVKVRF